MYIIMQSDLSGYLLGYVRSPTCRDMCCLIFRDMCSVPFAGVSAQSDLPGYVRRLCLLPAVCY